MHKNIKYDNIITYYRGEIMFDYYKDFNFKNITSPKYRHLFYVLFWPAYLLLFVLIEKYVVAVYDMHCPLDDVIPFCEFFVIPYVLWYALLAFTSFYGLLFDISAFKKLYKFLCISAAVSFLIYVLFPNMQNLRPENFARDNIFTDIMKNLYALDTNTNVCPSIHVTFSMGMLFSLWNSKHFSTPPKRCVAVIIAVLVSISTVFLKQHSVLDILAGAVLSVAVLPFITEKRKGGKAQN